MKPLYGFNTGILISDMSKHILFSVSKLNFCICWYAKYQKKIEITSQNKTLNSFKNCLQNLFVAYLVTTFWGDSAFASWNGSKWKNYLIISLSHRPRKLCETIPIKGFVDLVVVFKIRSLIIDYQKQENSIDLFAKQLSSFNNNGGDFWFFVENCFLQCVVLKCCGIVLRE